MLFILRSMEESLSVGERHNGKGNAEPECEARRTWARSVRAVALTQLLCFRRTKIRHSIVHTFLLYPWIVDAIQPLKEV